MITNNFVSSFIEPSVSHFNKSFQIALPGIPGLRKCGDFIIQSELEETFSTNILAKYVNEDNNLRLVEVYKSSENRSTGSFIRLAGTISLVKMGWPAMFLDAAVTNVNMRSGQREKIQTRVAVHLPQADDEQRELLFRALSQEADQKNHAHRELGIDALPAFWGHIWLAEEDALRPEMIRTLRDAAAGAYQQIYKNGRPRELFDYLPMQQHIIFNNSRAEHLLFQKAGLSVPVEAQAAFFSALAVW
jgi:plasmid stability protein